jgi:flagellar basal body-associated protein FliL
MNKQVTYEKPANTATDLDTNTEHVFVVKDDDLDKKKHGKKAPFRRYLRILLPLCGIFGISGSLLAAIFGISGTALYRQQDMVNRRLLGYWIAMDILLIMAAIASVQTMGLAFFAHMKSEKTRKEAEEEQSRNPWSMAVMIFNAIHFFFLVCMFVFFSVGIVLATNERLYQQVLNNMTTGTTYLMASGIIGMLSMFSIKILRFTTILHLRTLPVSKN